MIYLTSPLSPHPIVAGNLPRQRGRLLADGAAVGSSLEVLTGDFYAGNPAEEGYLPFVAG